MKVAVPHGAQVQEALTIGGAVGINARLVGRGKQAAHQFGIGELAPEDLLHDGQSPTDHRRGIGRSWHGSPSSNTTHSIGWSEIGGPDIRARCGDTVIGGDAAAIGVFRNGAVLLHGGDRDRMASQLRYASGQTRPELGGGGIDPVIDTPFGPDLSRAACASMVIACAPYKNCFLLCVFLRKGGYGSGVVLAYLFIAVIFDISVKAHGYVQDIDLFPQSEFEKSGITGVSTVQLCERGGLVTVISGRDSEHGDIGTPGHSVMGIGIGYPIAGCNAGDPGSVGMSVAVLVLRSVQETLGNGGVCKRRVIPIDAGIDKANGDAFPGLHIASLEEAQMGIGMVGANGFQAPLISETRFAPVIAGPLLRLPEKYLPCDAAKFKGRVGGNGVGRTG